MNSLYKIKYRYSYLFMEELKVECDNVSTVGIPLGRQIHFSTQRLYSDKIFQLYKY
jgi:hypothetical protein